MISLPAPSSVHLSAIHLHLFLLLESCTYAVFIIPPHSPTLTSQSPSNFFGVTLGISEMGKWLLYGGICAIRWKKRHFGSGCAPEMSSGRSDASSEEMMDRHSVSEEHLGFSVFSSVVPCMSAL